MAARSKNSPSPGRKQTTAPPPDPAPAPARCGADLALLPAISRLLESRPVRLLVRRHGAGLVTDLLRDVLRDLRLRIRERALAGPELRRAVSTGAVSRAVAVRIQDLLRPRPCPVINATGIVVHTNLGRSVLSAEAAERVATVARGYMDLEFDLAAGGRGSRQSHLAPLMERLFPGMGFLVVNNNAAATMICLRALSRGKQVLISRGELVEIGGSFRVPDILAASGARLCEVGTTNRTRLADYRDAVSPKTGVILKVHTSNFKIVGFTEETTVQSLAGLARQTGLPLVVDWGSGDLVDLGPFGIDDEMPVSQVLAAGADLVSFSGDKLLGGPQAGFVVGRPDLIARLRRDPLARVCRLDRLLVAAMHQTLAAYVQGRQFEDVPTLRMLAAGADEIDRRARRVQRVVSAGTRRQDERGDAATGVRLTIVDGVSRTGGGSSPTGERPTRLLSVEVPGGDAGALAVRLRRGTLPVVGRVHDGKLLLDLRTVLPDQEDALAACLIDALAST